MHPPLAEHQHSGCALEIDALKTCHAAHPALKFLGVCNADKKALTLCLRAERLARAGANMQESKEKKARLQAKWREIDAQE